MAEKIVKDSQGLAKELVNGVKEFEELKVIDLNGRPYYSIIYLENGNEFEGYASYNLKVISEYLKRHFGFAQPETHDKRTGTHACDLIDRAEAIEAIEKHIRTAEEPYQLTDADKVMNHAFEIAASCVYNLSAAQPERKKGKWITSDDMYETGVCSVCKCDSQEPVSYAITMFKYCQIAEQI